MLLPLFTRPEDDATSWQAAARAGPEIIVMVHQVIAAVRRLRHAGTRVIGHVSLGYGTQPSSVVSARLREWSATGISGVFLDHAPTSLRSFDQVSRAVRSAHLGGLGYVVLNAGGPVHPGYRDLDAVICTFEGSWTDYLAWSGEESEEGDGHLVFDVPVAARPVALGLVAERGAGLYLISERINAYGYAAGVGRAGTSTTSGS